jgi:hypothetical protein
MYGYVFAAAKHDMWHHIDRHSMLYPSYVPATPPKVLHYGLEHEVLTADGRNFTYDKHWHMYFKFDQCPPWEALTRASDGGLIQHPPSPKDLVPSKVRPLLFALRLPKLPLL